MATDPQSESTNNSKNSNVGWPVVFGAIQNPPGWLSATVVTGLSLLAIFLFAVSLVAFAQLTTDLLGSDRSRASEALKSVLPIVAAAVGLPLIIWRLVILNRQTNTAEAKTQIDRETHYTSIFSRSIEQLGQTREVIQHRETENGVQAITKTVPNIEVRLGGIHSLTRLADESLRDAKKIESMLLSYVRENSWSNRDGFTASRPPIEKSNTFAWGYYHRADDLSERAAQALQEWKFETTEIATENRKWGTTLSDTRVDVNEAIEAIPNLPYSENGLSTFYECLFVGRLFKSSILKVTTFDRCTFFNCTFDVKDAHNLSFRSCRFVDSSLSGDNSNISLRNCLLIETKVSSFSSSSVKLWNCDAHGLTLSQLKNAKIEFAFSAFLGGWVGTEEPIVVAARYSDFASFGFTAMTFAAETRFSKCGLAATRFNSSDLSLVTFDETSLAHTNADPKTKLPEDLKRPSSWPDYDPNYDDEIPF